MADVNFRALGEARFPEYRGDININMMPFLMGIEASIPTELLGYAEMALACTGREEFGKVGYLTIHESFQDGSPQRRPGLHTEGFGDLSWGGGSWGGYGGLFLANSLPEVALSTTHSYAIPTSAERFPKKLSGTPLGT